MATRTIVLGIETSCDETAAAVVAGDRTVLAERVLSQLEDHAPYGGVVPEIAARAHLNHLDRLVAATMAAAGLEFGQLSAVAATGGPGLIGGVMVGVMTAKAIAAVHKLPFLAINHLEGHALSPRLTDDVPFPYLLLLVSGGHCQLLVVEGIGRYVRLGGTVDDAAGEAFDKVAKMLGLGYPGGPAVERAAAVGTPGRFRLPRPMKGREGADFSFAGLKTAVRHALAQLPGTPTAQDAADLCRDFQDAVAEIVADRSTHAVARFRRDWPQGRALVVAGGVAANTRLRGVLGALAAEAGLDFVAPPLRYCTDNAAMIAWAGIERLALGQRDGMDFAPRPRWPLVEAA
ncbi:MAG: tRNA (adenosine(37)-N6)-threonylcarbamoyltransferase complex transferase subunit TsaD [Rhodospirillaceae bacterium]|nr:tRNA (adenosine(37)-N6)-threonylcarbamoyltransferase complex transferase subunit TsaD [Rhodospirillaceae bacterium]